MKNSVINFLIENFDVKHGMIVAFKMHLSENQILHVGFFPDQATSEEFVKQTKPVVDQIKQMGAKHEVMKGSLNDFMIAGDITLDQLTGKC